MTHGASPTWSAVEDSTETVIVSVEDAQAGRLSGWPDDLAGERNDQ